MHVSSEEPLVVRHFVYRLYSIMLGLMLLGIVAEGVLIGPSLFAATHWGRVLHGDLGAALLFLLLLLPVIGRIARLPGKIILLSSVLFVLALIEAIAGALGRRSPVLAAVHPATALLLAGLTVLLFLQGWHTLRGRGTINIKKESAE